MYKQIIPTQEEKNENTISYAVRANKVPLSNIDKDLRECANCSKIKKGILKCPNCKIAHFCCDKCYKEGYKHHKKICKHLNNKSKIDYNKELCITIGVKMKLYAENYKESFIYTSGKKYWRVIIEDWEDNYMLWTSVSREEVNEYFEITEYDEKSDRIVIYQEEGTNKGMKLNMMNKDKCPK